MIKDEKKAEKKLYTSYDEYYATFYGNQEQGKNDEWDESPSSFAKWLVRFIANKAATKKSSEGRMA